MKLTSLVGSLVACLTVTVAPALHAAPLSTDTVTQNRGEIIAELMQSWQHRISSQGLAVEDAKNWSLRSAAKFARLTDAQLQMAQRAGTIQEVELLFITAPIADGTSLAAIASARPGNITIAPGPFAKSGGDSNSNPTGSPALYSDLVFTAVTPCRVYDSRFSTAPPTGAPGAPWAANTVNVIDFGPQASYAFEGGQATNCAGTLVGPSQIAAAMTAVSTVNQTGAGYLVFYSSGGTNPNPNGVAQWFQPGYVQTSFVVMPTDLISNVFSNGFIGNAGSHVIVDLIGYFAKPKAALWAVINADGTLSRGSRISAVTAPAKLLTGSYQVTFDRDVTTCKYDATIGTATAGGAPAGNIAVSPRSGNVNAVFIATYNSAGTGTDQPFHLAVTCP